MINPNYAEAYNNMGNTQKDLGDPETAIELHSSHDTLKLLVTKVMTSKGHLRSIRIWPGANSKYRSEKYCITSQLAFKIEQDLIKKHQSIRC